MNGLAIHIENASVCYGNTLAINNVCLDVADGEYIGIIGPNGGGKSTLLKAILGLVPVNRWQGACLRRKARKDLSWQSGTYRNMPQWTSTFQ